MPLLLLLILPTAFAGRFAGIRFGFLAGLAAVVATLAAETGVIIVLGGGLQKRREAKTPARRETVSSHGSVSGRHTARERDDESDAAAIRAGSIGLFDTDSVDSLDAETRRKLVQGFYDSLKDAFGKQVGIDVPQGAAEERHAPEASDGQLMAFRSPDGHRAGFASGAECFWFPADALKSIELWSLAPAKGPGGFSVSLYFIDKDALEGPFAERWALIAPCLKSFDLDIGYGDDTAAAVAIAIERIAAMLGAKSEIHEGADV